MFVQGLIKSCIIFLKNKVSTRIIIFIFYKFFIQETIWVVTDQKVAYVGVSQSGQLQF